MAFFPDLGFFNMLKYIWHITLCKFKVYNKLILYIYVLQYDCLVDLAKTSIVLHDYHFFFCDGNNQDLVF